MTKPLTVEEIRRANINYWADKYGRNVLAKKAGYSDTVYINQLCAGHGSFGSRTARRIEKALGLERGEFDTPGGNGFTNPPEAKLPTRRSEYLKAIGENMAILSDSNLKLLLKLSESLVNHEQEI